MKKKILSHGYPTYIKLCFHIKKPENPSRKPIFSSYIDPEVRLYHHFKNKHAQDRLDFLTQRLTNISILPDLIWTCYFFNTRTPPFFISSSQQSDIRLKAESVLFEFLDIFHTHEAFFEFKKHQQQVLLLLNVYNSILNYLQKLTKPIPTHFSKLTLLTNANVQKSSFQNTIESNLVNPLHIHIFLHFCISIQTLKYSSPNKLLETYRQQSFKMRHHSIKKIFEIWDTQHREDPRFIPLIPSLLNNYLGLSEKKIPLSIAQSFINFLICLQENDSIPTQLKKIFVLYIRTKLNSLPIQKDKVLDIQCLLKKFFKQTPIFPTIYEKSRRSPATPKLPPPRIKTLLASPLAITPLNVQIEGTSILNELFY